MERVSTGAVSVLPSFVAGGDGQAGAEELFQEANRWHSEFERRYNGSIQAAINAGEALLAAKRQVPRGKWMEWVSTHFVGSHDLANKYMRVADNSERVLNHGAGVSLRGALAEITAANRKRRSTNEGETCFWGGTTRTSNGPVLLPEPRVGTAPIWESDGAADDFDDDESQLEEAIGEVMSEKIGDVLSAAERAYGAALGLRHSLAGGDDVDSLLRLAGAADRLHDAGRRVEEHLVEMLEAQGMSQREIHRSTRFPLRRVRQILGEGDGQ